jgi:SAM-dependent methyltransferase
MGNYDNEYFNTYLPTGSWNKGRAKRKWFNKSIVKNLSKLNLWKDASILEIGCGVGFLTSEVTEVIKPKIILATDISEYALTCLKNNVSEITQMSVRQIDYEQPQQFSSSFHFILAFDVIEHVKNTDIFLKTIYSNLHPGGYVILSTPNTSSLGKIRKEKIGLNWFAYNDPTHINLQNEVFWGRKFESHNLIVERWGTDFFWDPPYISKYTKFFEKPFCAIINRLIHKLFFAAHNFRGENLYFILKKGNVK